MTNPSIRDLAVRASAAARLLLTLSTRRKRSVLNAIADTIEERAERILASNALDVDDARAQGRDPGTVERLEISSARFSELVRSFRTIADLKDPTGETISRWIRPNGLEIVRTRVPIGVVAVPFQSRPHVVANAAALCLKIGNALLLVGDQDARRTGEALLDAIREGGESKGLPPDAVQGVFTDDPRVIHDLARQQGLVDLLIPRGSHDFVAGIVRDATVPVLKHRGSVCHIYVDAEARIDMAIDILRDARCIEPYACNSVGTVLVHPDALDAFQTALQADADLRNLRWTGDAAPARPADDPVPAEQLHLITLQVLRVNDTASAVQRINAQGSHLSDAIVTESEAARDYFLRHVDSACVCVNTSPRFADGGEFGMGAEIGFSTDKFHARGPLGIEELTSAKYLVQGKGQLRG